MLFYSISTQCAEYTADTWEISSDQLATFASYRGRCSRGKKRITVRVYLLVQFWSFLLRVAGEGALESCGYRALNINEEEIRQKTIIALKMFNI